MLRDIRNGKQCEIEEINGIICAYGRKYGIATPVNDRIVEIIKKENLGELEPKAENIAYFEDII